MIATSFDGLGHFVHVETKTNRLQTPEVKRLERQTGYASAIIEAIDEDLEHNDELDLPCSHYTGDEPHRKCVESAQREYVKTDS